MTEIEGRRMAPAGEARRRDRMRQVGAVGTATTGAAAALLATLASACCVGPVLAPLVVAVLGVSGSVWAAGLKPYSPFLLAGSFLLLAYGFRNAYRARPACDDGGCSLRTSPSVRVVLWISAALWCAAVGLNLLQIYRGGW